ncbi:MAG: YitT family protein [Clostridia bacterium]|nr:YitT family protein [Clostridia bacterium]
MKIKATKKQTVKFIIQIILVALAGVVGGGTFKCFFEPLNIIPTGMSGFAKLVSLWLSYIGLSLPTSVIYLVLNIALFACALKFFGWKFLVLSGVGLGTYVLGMQFLGIDAIIQDTSAPLLYCLVGSIISGACVGIAMRMGGSTGGSDIFGALINRVAPKIKTGYAILIFNVIVLILSIVTLGLSTGLYALINSILSSIVTDMVLDKSKKIVAFNIICNKPEEVASAIMKHYGRGVTRMDGTGMFTHNDKAVLLCLVPYDQSYKMREFVLKIDSGAFVYSTPVTETIGENNMLKAPLKATEEALKNLTQPQPTVEIKEVSADVDADKNISTTDTTQSIDKNIKKPRKNTAKSSKQDEPTTSKNTPAYKKEGTKQGPSKKSSTTNKAAAKKSEHNKKSAAKTTENM